MKMPNAAQVTVPCHLDFNTAEHRVVLVLEMAPGECCGFELSGETASHILTALHEMTWPYHLTTCLDEALDGEANVAQ